MSEPVGAPLPYRVSYSERVRDELRALVARARERGLATQVLDAVRAMDRTLRLYPQVGQPLRDLRLDPAQIWIATFPPLVVQYYLDEGSRQVMVVVPILPLTRSGLQP